IIAFNVMSQEIADLLGTIILGECNVIYGGLTGSGKTTSIRALLDHYVSQANKRMLVCEDTQELFPKNDHTLELVSVRNDDPKLEITLQEIIYTALRLKPKYICVGEVRGLEAESAVEAMETGHSTIFTMHGGKPMNIVNRLVTKYLSAMPTLGIDVVERIIGSAVDYIVLQDDIPDIGRKVTSITEVSFDFEKGRVALKTIFEYDFLKGDFEMVNKISQEKAKNMLRRGVKIETLKPLVEGWSEELKIA
ncbi:ATPase, T2SS/T4P/T4SS family, partial [Bacillus toyonensis]